VVHRGEPVRNLLRVCVLLSFVSALTMAEGQAALHRTRIVVSVFNAAGLDPNTLREAEITAQAIFQQAGLTILWKNCPAQPGQESESCVQKMENRHLVLHIEHQPRTLAADAYGVAFLGAVGWGMYCDVFSDRISDLHRHTRLSESRILGIVAAHELGHLLLGSHAHSPSGIMRPRWRPADFSGQILGATYFSPRQAQEISDSLNLAQAPERDGPKR